MSTPFLAATNGSCEACSTTRSLESSLLTVEGRITYANSAYGRLLGRSVEELLELAAIKERSAFALESAHQGVCDHNILTGEIYLSPTWKSMLGYADDEVANTRSRSTGSSATSPLRSG